jgi:chemotaxis protein histidine kinase CheA
LVELGSKKYKDQAIWFLNAFWTDFGQREAEKIWEYTHRFASLDQQKHEEGNSLDEFMTHHFLEQNKETLTVLQMREHLRSVGIEKVKLIPLTHFFIFRYRVDWHKLVNAPQGNQEEIAKAQRMLDEVQKAFEQAKAAEKEAVAREADAHARAEESRAAQHELELALAELKAQEDAFNNTTKELTRKSEEGSVVARNKAKNELAQHLSSDPLPLRRAKITQEAAVKKAERATAAAQAAAQEAAAARQAAEEAVQEAHRRVQEAEEYLEEVKRTAGSGQGAIWWIDRELHEAKAYMPTSKGGYKKEKKI